MRDFLFFILKILGLILLILISLDLVYSSLYSLSHNRGKIDYVYNSMARNYDVVILGSSRANNHFVAKMFNDKGLNAFNFGISGSGTSEASLLLKLMMERKYKIKNVIIEIDLDINSDLSSKDIKGRFLPYIHQSDIIREHVKSLPDYNKLYYIPFYRYIEYDSQIGFREMVFSAINKKTSHLDHYGYYALNDIGENMSYDLSDRVPKKNKSYEEIKQICKENNINLIAVSTPMCENVKNLDYFKQVSKLYPEVHNYEDSIRGDKYFSSCGHMNNQGAVLFTSKIIRDFFNKQTPKKI